MLHSGTEPHIEYRTDNEDINKRPTEIEANIKSGELLIPFNLLKKEYLKLEIPSSITLSKIFEVSVNVMEARLNKLGVSYFNGNGEAITYGDR